VQHLVRFPHSRNEGLGGTDARRIAAGEWRDLWLEKRGGKPVDLSHVFKVQLGLATEPLHAEWFIRQTGKPLKDLGDFPMTSDQAPEPFMFATLDRWIVPDEMPLELKHTNEFATLESSAAYYMAQLQHQLMVTNCSLLYFSIIRGNNEPVHGTVQRDDAYCAKLLAQEQEFWRMLQAGEEPPVMGNEDPDMTAMVPEIPINGRREYDLGKNNEFVSVAADYRRLKPQADEFKVVDKQLRTLIPADASVVRGGGLTLKRDARGAFRCTIEEDQLV
jgi:predicted phage-related endonuclease